MDRSGSCHLAEIRTFIARDNPVAANRISREIKGTAERLQQFPEIGALRAYDSPETVVVGRPYILKYDLWSGRIRVLRVWHGARNRILQSDSE